MDTAPADPSHPRRRTVVSGGVPLAVTEQGDPARPTVLLVHGYPDTHRVWDDVAADLAADHHVVRYDVRGAGGSGAPATRGGYRLEQLAADLRAVADAVSPDRPVHLAAHDWGSIQSWEAVTEPDAGRRIASFTSLSGPCLDHVGLWYRERLARPTPRGLRQLLVQSAHSWYIAAFRLPWIAPAVWRLGLARHWGRLLAALEGVQPRPGHPAPTLARDAVRGIELYRASFGPRMRSPRRRTTDVPVQLVTLTGDRYVRPALSEGLEGRVSRLRRRTLRAGHWSALLVQGPAVAALVREFAAAHEPR
ncbi:alpha/beta fold hydrolase [Streptomyces sp. NPDC001380]|uniref:alpha/beta fold hydrolase n=1 Tax=Streptomyces sp. NPDC001380 TaxID=3364566 RepID=UPI0036CD581F